MIKIEVIGTVDIDNSLSELSTDIENDFKNLLKKTAEKIRDDAKRIVPVRTGTLRNSIDINKLNEFEYSIGSDLYYAGFVEYGTIKMKPSPYMRQASDVGEEFLNSRIEDSLKIRIEVLNNGRS